MKNYDLVQRWMPKTEIEFLERYRKFNNDPDFLACKVFDSIESLVVEIAYKGIEFDWFVQLTTQRFDDAIEIIEYDSKFYVFIGML